MTRQQLHIRSGARASFDALVIMVREKAGSVYAADIPLIAAVAEAQLDYERARAAAANVPKIARDGNQNPEHKALADAQRDYISARSHLYSTVIGRPKPSTGAVQEGAQPGRRRSPGREGVPHIATVSAPKVTWIDALREKRANSDG
jgi:hypothetical protein